MSLKDYTRKDIVEIREYLISLIEKIDTEGRWTDRNESDLGMIYVELAAGVADMLNFYIDKQALENYLPTVTQRKNLKRILSLVGYKMKSPTSATCKGNIILSRTLNFDITIPKYFQVSYYRDGGNIYYAVAQDTDIHAGSTFAEVDLVQGISKEINLTVADLIQNRTITIRDTMVAEGSIMITIGNTIWEEVPDVLIDEDYGTKYSVFEDNEDLSVIEFGYSWKDYLPADYTTPVVIKYLSTAGSAGAVKKGLINTIEQDLYVTDPETNIRTNLKESLSVTNLEDAAGGSDRETMEEAKRKAPRLVKSRKLMTTLEDYETMAEDQLGIHLAKAIDWTIENSLYVGVPYQVQLYIVPEDKGIYEASASLIERVCDALKPYLWTSIDLQVLPAVIHDIDVVIEVYTSSDSSNWSGLRREVEDIVTDFFNKNNCKFGSIYTRGQIESAIANNSTMAEYVEILEPESTIKLKPMEFPRLNRLDVYVRSLDFYNESGN